MFIASFPLKTSIQKWLFTIQDFLDFARLHPAREMKKLALAESVQYIRQHMPNAVGMESAREVLAKALGQVTVAGHYLEFGVYKGGTIRFIADRVGSSQRVHGFDSFTGLEEDWSGDPSRFDARGRLPKVPSHVTLHKGLFADTLPGWLEKNPGPAAFLHIDCDLYRPAKTVLDLLQDRIVPGTVIVFDEYFNYPNWQEHEYRAFRELVEQRQIQYQYLAYARFQTALQIAAIASRVRSEPENSPLAALHGAPSNLSMAPESTHK
jgi:hypothetical protein